jgi:hypothetical protein
LNGAAMQQIIQDQNRYAAAVAAHTPGAVADDAALQRAATLKALIDCGVNNAVHAEGLNGDARVATASSERHRHSTRRRRLRRLQINGYITGAADFAQNLNPTEWPSQPSDAQACVDKAPLPRRAPPVSQQRCASPLRLSRPAALPRLARRPRMICA